MQTSLPVINVDEARFECTYGRGCPGLCCFNSYPPVTAEEAARIENDLAKFLPHLRPSARKLIEKKGFVSRRTKMGLPTLRVDGGQCVFFHDGCVLHKAGLREGDRNRYKPAVCALFPLEQDLEGNWFVRQKDYAGEAWDLPCLDPSVSTTPARTSLASEIELAQSLEDRGLSPFVILENA
jgi:hypothetical protein